MKIALKNFLMTLKRYKVASLLNVVGLTLAFVAFYIIASQVWYSVTYNHSLADADRTYLVQVKQDNTGAYEDRWSTNTPQPACYEALEMCPDTEVAASLITHPSISQVWKKSSDYNFEKFPIGVNFGNANMVDLFGFECIAGDLKRVAEPNTVIMARSAAEQMGVGLGDQIWFEGGDWHDNGKPEQPVTIVAVYEDFSLNTFLNSVRIFYNDNLVNGQHNGNWNYSFFVRLNKEANTEKFASLVQEQYAKWQADLASKWLNEHPEDAEEIRKASEKRMPVRLTPLNKMYYNTDNADTAFETGTRSSTIILTAIGLIVIVVAFINFINFFFALVPVRMRSVNICKVFGASQATLRWNFLFEAIGLVLISMVLALYLMIVIKESFIAKYVTCSLSLGENIPVIAIMIVLMILLAIIAAIYPAFYITRFNASLGVKGGFAQSATGRRLRSIMVGVQFCVAIILIIITAVFFIQYRYMVNFDMGFNREHIVTFYGGDVGDKEEALIGKLLQHPDAVDATTSHYNIFHANSIWGRFYNECNYQLRPNSVRWNFLDFFGFKVVDGTSFTPSSAERDEMVIMQSMNRKVGLPIGYNFPEGFAVTGIMKDVMLTGAGIAPEEYYSFICSNKLGDRNFYYIRLGVNADIQDFANYVRDVCKEFNPTGDDVDIYFLNDWVDSLYNSTRNQTIVIGLFALLAIVIALMGVFGIVMFETQHRRSEIAVRKVYGATTAQMIKMLNLRYVWIVFGCFFVAAPVAWYFTSRWLEQFANRIAQPWWIYLVALVVVLAVTVGLVTLRSWKAATENPADVVKNN